MCRHCSVYTVVISDHVSLKTYRFGLASYPVNQLNTTILHGATAYLTFKTQVVLGNTVLLGKTLRATNYLKDCQSSTAHDNRDQQLNVSRRKRDM